MTGGVPPNFSRPTTANDRIVESFDGYNSYLLIVDELSRYTWIFLTKSKEPPVEICQLFMKEFANEKGGMVRCDQGEELARSEAWRTMLKKDFQYTVEPTGADSPSQNGQVERYNETVGTIIQTLLYGSHLPAKYWSAAALHAVYLMNRRVHSTTGITPFEAWWDELPDLSKLRIFGSRVCVKVIGKRRAKLDRHDFTGIFVGYTATDDNIRYIDVKSGILKTSHHAVFDEAWYLQPQRPPMAQLLYDMGMEPEDDFVEPPPNKPIPPAEYPPLPTEKFTVDKRKAKQSPIPLRLSAEPICRQQGARAANAEIDASTIFTPAINRLDIITDMQLDKEEVFAQVYLSPDPYHEAFKENIDIRRWTSHDHPTAGLSLIKRDDRLILANIEKSTPAAKIDKWQSRCRGAWLQEVG